MYRHIDIHIYIYMYIYMYMYMYKPNATTSRDLAPPKLDF